MSSLLQQALDLAKSDLRSPQTKSQGPTIKQLDFWGHWHNFALMIRPGQWVCPNGQGSDLEQSLATLSDACQQGKLAPRQLIGELAKLVDLSRLETVEFDWLEDRELPDIRSMLTPREIRFHELPNLKAIPRWLADIPSLRVLDIMACPKIKTVPGWLADLTQLETLKLCDFPHAGTLPCFELPLVLEIAEFPKLRYLPAGFESTIKIRGTRTIHDYPRPIIQMRHLTREEALERARTGKGVTLHKIA